MGIKYGTIRGRGDGFDAGGDVDFGDTSGDNQLVGYLLIGRSRHQQMQHFGFTGRERFATIFFRNYLLMVSSYI